MRSMALMLAALLVVETSQALEVESYGFQGLVEGLSLGDLDGDGRSEIVALLRNGTAADAQWTNGSVVALDMNGGLLWERKGANYLTGLVTTADFDGDGKREVTYCDSAAAGHCFVVRGNGQLRWQTSELNYPAITNMGPAASDLTQDGIVDLVVASWGGTVAAYDGPSGVELWRYEAYQQLGELLHCNPLLFDLNGDHVDDVVVLGYQKGLVIALDGADGHLLWNTPSFQQAYTNYSRGNGILVTELREGHGKELLVPMRGATDVDSAVFGIARNGTVLFRAPIPGRLSYQSPVTADVDGDGQPEIYLQSRNGVLYRLDGQGTVVSSVTIGNESWMAPAFVDADQDGTVEVVASSTTGVQILKGEGLTLIDEVVDLGQGLQPPSPVVADVERDGEAEILLGSWYGTELFRLQLTSKSWWRWDTVGGTPRHQGVHSKSPYDDVKQSVIGLSVLADSLGRMAQASSGSQATALERAVENVQEGLLRSSGGEHHLALLALRDVERELRGVGTAVSSHNVQLAQVAVDAAGQSWARLTALYGSNNGELEDVESALIDAQDELDDGHLQDALAAVAAIYVQIELASGSMGNHCGDVLLNEPYLNLECELLVKALEITSNAEARDSALLGIRSLALLDVMQAGSYLEQAVAALPAGDPITASLSSTLRKVVRLYLDDRRIAGAVHATSVEAAYEAGVAALSAGNIPAAAEQFVVALAATGE